MAFNVLIEHRDGEFVATLAGVPDVSVVAPTHSEAVFAIRSEIQQRVDAGELLLLDLDQEKGVTSLAGAFQDDPTLRQICADAYRWRDAEVVD